MSQTVDQPAPINCRLPEPELNRILAEFPAGPDSLIPMMHAVQKQLGYLRPETIHPIADHLGLPPSRVYGVATFYSLLATEPKGKYIIRVCGSAPCYAVGSDSILSVIRDILAINPGETSTDGLFTLEVASCLGVCGVAPAVMINDQVYGNLTPSKIQNIISDYRSRG